MTQEKKNTLRKWLGLVVTSMALAIIIIDTTVLNVSLRDIMRDLGTDLQTMQWVITIYSLVLAALTITGGRLGDLFGRKRMFMLGALLFGIGSFIASISINANMLLFGWSIVEGIGAALMMPATASMVISTFQGKERAIAFGVWGGVAGAASAFGPLLGGYLTATVSWHWAFRINVLVVALVLLGSVVITESIDKKERHTLDIVGSLLSALSMAMIVFGIVESSTYGWWIAKKDWIISFGELSITPVAIFVGMVLLALFIIWERRMMAERKTPLVSLDIFKNKQFVAGILVTSILSLGQAGIIFALPVFFQSVRSLDAFKTGQSLLPMSISILVIAPLSGLLRKRVATRDLVQIGLLTSALGAYLVYSNLDVSANPSDFTWALVALGAGMGLTMSQISNVTLSAIDPNMAGEASGINNTIRQLGSSLGSALIGAVFLATISTTMITRINSSEIIPAAMKPVVIQQVETNNGQSLFGGSAEKNPVFTAVITEVVSIKNKSTVDGGKKSLLYTVAFTLGSVLVSFILPREMKEKSGSVTHVATH
ncbi:MFS transporter [bacterium]|nr:MFS transporter [bacterium]